MPFLAIAGMDRMRRFGRGRFRPSLNNAVTTVLLLNYTMAGELLFEGSAIIASTVGGPSTGGARIAPDHGRIRVGQ